MKTLVVIDMQNDFITGALANPEAQKIIPFIKEKIAEFRKEGRVIYTKDTHFNNYLNTLEGKHLPVPHCVEGTKGWEIVDELKPTLNDYVFQKSDFGLYEGLIEKDSNREDIRLCRECKIVGWDDILLADKDDIYICGTCTDICVISNALIIKAACPESEIYVFKDGCAGLTKEKHEHALDVMASCQINII